MRAAHTPNSGSAKRFGSSYRIDFSLRVAVAAGQSLQRDRALHAGHVGQPHFAVSALLQRPLREGLPGFSVTKRSFTSFSRETYEENDVHVRARGRSFHRVLRTAGARAGLARAHCGDITHSSHHFQEIPGRMLGKIGRGGEEGGEEWDPSRKVPGACVLHAPIERLCLRQCAAFTELR